MSLSKPAATFALTGSSPSRPGGPLDLAQAGVRRCTVELSVDESHDWVELVLWHRSALADAAPDASLRIGIGDQDGVEDVITVEVFSVEAGSQWATLTGFAPSRRLSSTYVGRAYSAQSLAAIVTDLLGEGNVDAGEIAATLTLPALHVDPQRSVWGHLHVLGRRFGHQVTSTAAGAVSFGPAPGVSSARGLGAIASGLPVALPFGSTDLREGAEFLSFSAGSRSTDTAVEAVSPASSSAWYLLAAEPDSGSGAPVDVDPKLRTRDAADTATQGAKAAASRRSERLRARVPGRASLRAGAVVSARGESRRVLRVRHIVDANTGYVCDLVMEGAQ